MRHDKGWAGAAILVSAVLHILLAWAVLRLVIDVVPPPRIIHVILVRPKPPPPPKPVAAKKTAPVPRAPPVPKPIPHAAPRPITQAKPNMRVQRSMPAPPVGHFGTSGAGAGLGLNIGSPSGGGGAGSIGNFDDAVKQRIQAAKTYPPGIPYMWNECVVEYQVTVDTTGQLVSYKLYGCNDPFLDSAARAAILMASPFPVPPNFGGSQYTVFGSLVFKHN
jgi:protein TonB